MLVFAVLFIAAFSVTCIATNIMQLNIMHLSMLGPRVAGGGGGGGADPGDFDIFWKPKSNSPPLGT